MAVILRIIDLEYIIPTRCCNTHYPFLYTDSQLRSVTFLVSTVTLNLKLVSLYFVILRTVPSEHMAIVIYRHIIDHPNSPRSKYKQSRLTGKRPEAKVDENLVIDLVVWRCDTSPLPNMQV